MAPRRINLARQAGDLSADACGLVSQAQASNVVGVELTKVSGTGSGAGSPATCVYSSTTTGAYFTLTTGPVQNGASLDAITRALNTASFQSVGGIGEEAGEAKDPKYVKIAFVKGSVLVILTAASPTVSGDRWQRTSRFSQKHFAVQAERQFAKRARAR